MFKEAHPVIDSICIIQIYILLLYWLYWQGSWEVVAYVAGCGWISSDSCSKPQNLRNCCSLCFIVPGKESNIVKPWKFVTTFRWELSAYNTSMHLSKYWSGSMFWGYCWITEQGYKDSIRSHRSTSSYYCTHGYFQPEQYPQSLRHTLRALQR